ncbi:MAG: hypothetical protein LBQ19_04865 [Synergistaceae bacterium]|jgi:hypothetical protein|nr:hypothetical protein [Synergistaceae bacterium]
MHNNTLPQTNPEGSQPLERMQPDSSGLNLLVLPSHPSLQTTIQYNSLMLKTSGSVQKGGEGLGESIEWTVSTAKGYAIKDERSIVPFEFELINTRLDEHAKHIDDVLNHTKEMVYALMEANRRETELKIDADKERTELMLERRRRETELNIEANSRETEILIKNIRDGADRTEARFREDNEKSEARLEKFVREMRESNRKIQGFTMANIVGFTSLLIALAVLAWSIITLEIPTPPPVTINQTIPPTTTTTLEPEY